MTAGANIEVSHAFVLTSEDAEKLWAILSEFFEEVEASARCDDGVRREFHARDELAKYENPRTKAIRSLSFEARRAKPYSRVTLQFGGRYSSSVEVGISGPEETVLAVRERISELLDGMRPWYSLISRVDFFFVVSGVAFFAWLVLQGMSTGSASGKAMTFSQASVAAILLIAILCGVGLLIWISNRLRNRYFPTAAFAIGQGQRRFEVDEKIRWAVIIGFGVSLFASLVAAFLLPTA